MRRPEQLSEYLRAIVSTFLRREVEFPADTLVTVTRVEVSHNHRSATVWISVLPTARADDALAAIAAELYALQGTVNESVKKHPVPRVRFRIDLGPSHAAHIEELTRDLHE